MSPECPRCHDLCATTDRYCPACGCALGITPEEVRKLRAGYPRFRPHLLTTPKTRRTLGA